jgi:hypothetical protein
MTMPADDEDDCNEEVEEVIAASEDASEYIQRAVLKAIGHDEEGNGALRMLGVELELLRHAAVMAMTMRDIASASVSKEKFLSMAADCWDDAAQYDLDKEREVPT